MRQPLDSLYIQVVLAESEMEESKFFFIIYSEAIPTEG